MTIAPQTLDRLGKLFPRLASNHDGEVIATVRAIVRTLESAGASLHDLVGEMQPKVRVEERVVYRDPPKPNTTRKSPEKADPSPEPPKPAPPARGKFVPYEEVLRLAPLLLDKGLTDTETHFIQQLLRWAERYKSEFILTQKQASWWRRLILVNDIPNSVEQAE
ncbi:hypothetical protein [Neorhizobium galegae]|uniref:hypothetical protein n=1 Tax=Neorhizobium galegae TaxID=399 RepID=UPI002102F742|nr:hypothetical protein [Neorhizobium galegae]MCQ1850393.1 hypothetical protein [Neorhizobium galegae]